MSDTIATILGLLVLCVGGPLNAVVTLLLRRESRASPRLMILVERWITAACVLVAVWTFGLIFINNDQPVPWISTEATKLITRAAFLVLAIVPASVWLWLYVGGRR